MKLVTTTGVVELRPLANEKPYETLSRYGIPLSAVSISCEEPETQGANLERQGHFDGASRLIATANRNIDLLALAQASLRYDPFDEDPNTTRIIEKDFDSENPFDRKFVAYNSKHVVEIATDYVNRVLHYWASQGEGSFVVGVSGGGDSNLLLSALRSGRPSLDVKVMPAMVLGLRDWDNQLPAAEHLAKENGFPLKVISEREGAMLADIDSISECIARYEEEFPGAPIEYISTWYIRKVLSKFSHQVGSKVVLLGGNREDALAEYLYCMARGVVPMPVTARTVGETIFANPLGTMPKKLIDAAHPELSQRNYENRIENNDLGRSVFYLLAYIIQDRFPGLENDFLHGAERMSSERQIRYDEALHDYVHAESDEATVSKWKRVIRP